ncbi:MAG: hydantoinase B/oxoprolinase family protein, partial [Cyanobacteria bacterium J06554_11]
EELYRQRYGITLPDTALVVATITAEAIGRPYLSQQEIEETTVERVPSRPQSADAPVAMTTVSLFSADRWQTVPVYERRHLPAETSIVGPAIILEKTGTNILEDGWSAVLDGSGAMILRRLSQVEKEDVRLVDSLPILLAKPDPVRLEIFNNLFQAIAEQMGFTLQNTSSSVNIKERLDFSCAIFDGEGALVANAPHIPVHLGSMGESVKALIASSRDPFKPGDTFISNNPFNGGTHLPDVTAITPVFVSDALSEPPSAGQPEPSIVQPLFFVASRGHHADIGGITPGSMPPSSTHLSQEGILLDNFRLVTQGRLQARQLKELLTNNPYPARNPTQNLADLQAQIAANNKGVRELRRMVVQFGLSTVQAYMQHVQNNAEAAVRRVISQLYDQHGPKPMTCAVPMDCGATIRVKITLEPKLRSANIDFTGTSPQRHNNFNAPLSICKAAILYVFRTLVERPIPLNAGCLKPLNIVIPEGCVLNPSYPAAVVAGNVETSQAITDALYGALGALAASQGTMNNFTFGNARYQYYETICGGAGAGPSFRGADAVQTHMTNSRLTDPEVLETRFPVLLNEFAIRTGSGGDGRYPGGNGVVRDFSFLEQMTANMLSGRRSTQPFGIEGGQPGASGLTQVVRRSGQSATLPATSSVEVNPGDRVVIFTPGGGGYGPMPDLLA